MHDVVCTSTDSFAAVATRVIARTFEYESSPFANASAISGRFSRERATRTFSRAASGPMPHCQLSHCAVLAMTFERLLAIELSDERQKASRRGVDVAPELGDLLFERLERAPATELLGLEMGGAGLCEPKSFFLGCARSARGV
jgi:hypothetical protein